MAEDPVIPGAMFLDCIDLGKLADFKERHIDHRRRVSIASFSDHHLAIGTKKSIGRPADPEFRKHFF